MKHPLHVLMTTDTVGGVWTYSIELAAALAGFGVRTTLATMGAAPSWAQRAEARTVRGLELHVSRAALEWMENPWAEVDAAGEWLLEIAQAVRPDVVHLNGYSHASLPWSVPVVVAAHSCVLSWWQAVHGTAARGWEEYRRRVRLGLSAADIVVAPSTAMKHALEANYQFHTAVEVIPNGRAERHFAAARKGPLIFSAGRVWDEAKNLALLARIAPALAWPVRIAGGRMCPKGVEEEWVRELGSRVTLLGALAPSALARELSEAAIYAAPARYEPFGLGILEAAFSGCALVLSDLPSLREHWDGAAEFVPASDEKSWVAALNQLARDDERREQMAARAGARARCFNPRRMAAAYLDTYARLRARETASAALPVVFAPVAIP